MDVIYIANTRDEAADPGVVIPGTRKAAATRGPPVVFVLESYSIQVPRAPSSTKK